MSYFCRHRISAVIVTASFMSLMLSAPFSSQAGAALTFEHDVRPILKAYCLDCHGGSENLSGNLDLRLRRFAIKGGETGPAIVPGNAGASSLVARMKSGEMPPSGKKVPAEMIGVIEQWIASGAIAGREEPEQLPHGIDITPEDRAFWFYQPLQPVMPPKADEIAGHPSPESQPLDRRQNSAKTVYSPIDAFILSRLHARELSFAPEADRMTLIRRVAFDLTGLPPATSQIEEFINDRSAEAYEKMLDQFLQSTQYGERWGRHWLDVAGYADSEGNDGLDTPRPYAYKYRDYVIRSFNANLPFDQFIIEQMAGDELVPRPWQNLTFDQIEKLAATGFLRMGVDRTATATAKANDDEEMAANAVVGDVIKIVSSSLLGLSVGCAQCHDHKYDPIPQSDYFRIRSVFEPAFDTSKWRRPAQRLVLLYTDADRAKADAVNAEVKPMLEEYRAKEARYVAAVLERELEKLPEDQRAAVRQASSTPPKDRTDAQKKLLMDHPSANLVPSQLYLYDAAAAAELKKDYEKITAKGNEAPVKDYVSVTDEVVGTQPVSHLFYRGDYRQPRQPVSAGDLTIAAPEGQRFDIAEKDPATPTSGRRLAFARHLMNGNHPLVGRVLANRIWLHHFGRGFVETPGDFGILGTRPTHPELLDWLANEFARRDWNLKAMHRLIMTSMVYRQSSVAEPLANRSKLVVMRDNPTGDGGESSRLQDPRRIDSDNALYWHFPLKRLEAEALRDRMLLASGRLELTPFGPPVVVEEDFAGQVIVKDNKPRRSVYLQVIRTKPISFLTTFDAPIMTVNCERRISSTGAVQSLMLMNNESVLKEAEAFAARVRSKTPAAFSADLASSMTKKFPRYYTTAWHYGFGMFDEAPKRVTAFSEFVQFTGSTWKASYELDDPTVGGAELNATGGVAGDGPQHSAIRRWIAPCSGTLTIVGKLKRSSEKGDGVRGRIVSNRQGLLGEWQVKSGERATNRPNFEIEAGETIDFVTDCLTNATDDSFEWNAQLKLTDTTGKVINTWNSAADFHGTMATTLPQQIAYAWHVAYGRPISVDELEMSCQFVAEQIEILRATADNSDHELVALTSFCQQLMSSNEFLHVD